MSEVVLVAALGTGLVVALALRVFVPPTDYVAYALTFPRGLKDGEAVAALRALTGLLPPWWRRAFATPTVALEVAGTAAGIVHVLRVPAGRAEFVLGAWRAALPGLRVSKFAGDRPAPLSLARELRCSGAGSLRTTNLPATNAGVLAAVQPLGPGEVAVVQYAIAPAGRGLGVVLARLGAALLGEGVPERPDAKREPNVAVAIRTGVAAGDPQRSRQVMARLLGAFHPLATEEARLARRVIPSGCVVSRLQAAAAPDRGASLLRVDELAALIGIPLDGPQLPGLTLAGARELPAPAAVPQTGLVLGDSTGAGAGRPVAVAFGEVRRGVHVCAPTGAGKSTLLAGIACQLMAAGQGLILIDSKGDLAADVIDRVPEGRAGDVVVFDPADTERPVGFNLIGGAEEAELIVDHVVGQFRARYGASGLGPRSEDILRSCLLTLSTEPGYTLCEVEPLLSNAAFRQRLVGKLDEPVLESFWAWFGSLSEAARAEAIAPLANKIRSFTVRRRVRAVIGQSGGLDLSRVLAGNRVLVVSLARGLLGEDAAALIGAAMTARLWTAIQGRAALPPAERRPVTVICDEFQDFAALTVSFADAVAQSRGYGVGWVLAHQHLAQLDTTTRQAVLANCRSRLVMQTTAADAGAFAREFAPFLETSDLQGLGPYEGYAAVSAGAAVAPPASIRTRPSPPALGSAAGVRARSRERYGMAAGDVDAAIRGRIVGPKRSAPVGGRRRP